MIPRNGSSFGRAGWPAPPVSRRHRERQHLRHRSRVDPKPPRRFPPAQPLHIHRSPHLPVKFHAFHPSALCPSWQKTFCCRTFAPAPPAYPAASLRDFSTGALTLATGRTAIVTIRRDGGESVLSGGNTTSYVYDGATPISIGGVNMVTLPGSDEIVSIGGLVPLHDALGTTLATVNSPGTIATQYTYDPFGNVTPSSWAMVLLLAWAELSSIQPVSTTPACGSITRRYSGSSLRIPPATAVAT